MDPLLHMLRTHSFRRGTFTLTSGKQSDLFIDCKPTVLRARGHVLVGQAMLRAIDQLASTNNSSNSNNSNPITAVAGVELGGCSLASSVALLSHQRSSNSNSNSNSTPLDAVYVRKAVKAHGSRKHIEGADHLPLGAHLVVLEDTVTTGGSTLRAVATLQEAGFEVAGVVAIVDRCEGGRDAIEAAGLCFSSLYTRDDFIEKP